MESYHEGNAKSLKGVAVTWSIVKILVVIWLFGNNFLDVQNDRHLAVGALSIFAALTFFIGAGSKFWWLCIPEVLEVVAIALPFIGVLVYHLGVLIYLIFGGSEITSRCNYEPFCCNESGCSGFKYRFAYIMSFMIPSTILLLFFVILLSVTISSKKVAEARSAPCLNNTVSALHLNNTVPARCSYNAVPARRLNNTVPSRCSENVAPPRCSENVVPARRSDSVAPSKQRDVEARVIEKKLEDVD